MIVLCTHAGTGEPVPACLLRALPARLPEQRQREAGLLVCLRQDRDAGLLENRETREVRALLGDVGVADARLGGREVLTRDLEVRDRRVEPALDGAEGAAAACHRRDRGGDAAERGLR